MSPIPETSSLIEASSDITKTFKEILKANGINDPVSKVVIKDSGLQGENFASVTDYITVKFENSEKTPLNLFVKKHSNSKGHSQMIEEGRLFEKEAMFFMKYIPVARDYCKSLGKEDLMSIYPKCYYGDANIMVFENIVLDRGFTLIDKVEKQGMETAKLALSNLAKHHAISHAIINESGGPAKFFKLFPDLQFKVFLTGLFKDMMAPGMENGILVSIQLLEKSGLKESKEFVEIVKEFKGKPYQEVTELMSSESAKFMTLTHGDYWNNNMMFKKDPKTQELLKHVAVDFQVTYYGPPTLDLAYYFYTSVKRDVRQSRLPELLQIYFVSLKTTADQLGHPINLTIEELHQCFCKNVVFGLYFGCFLQTEAGMAVMKGLDIAKFENMTDFITEFDRLAGEWLDSHQEESIEIAKNLIEDMKQYRRLKMGILE